jgi:acid phosphatase
MHMSAVAGVAVRVAFVFALAWASGCSLIETPMAGASRGVVPCEAAPEPKHFRHAVIVVLENEDRDAALKDPYLNSLASQGALFTQFKGLFHNSYPNYLAMVGGREFPVSRWDSDAQIAVPAGPHGETYTIADRLPDAKNYAENYPFGDYGPRIASSGLYVRRHVPFASFVGASGAEHIVGVPGNIDDPDHRFFLDAQADSFPRYALYSPNLRNDGHDGGLATASPWLKKFVERFRQTPAAHTTLLVVTFDESARRGSSNLIYTVFLGEMVKPGVYDQPLNHYNVLRTIQDNFGVSPLADGDGGAVTIEGVWR